MFVQTTVTLMSLNSSELLGKNATTRRVAELPSASPKPSSQSKDPKSDRKSASMPGVIKYTSCVRERERKKKRGREGERERGRDRVARGAAG
eukprot:141372-Pyramimonas_sp.AAC.1